MNATFRALMFATLAFGLGGAAWAQQGSAEAFRACSGIVSGEARLACYDAAAAVAVRPAAAVALETAVSEPAEPATARFGKAPERRAEPNEVTVRIARVQRRENGKLLFVTDNGQAWAQTDTTSLRNLGEGPWTAVIRKAALGSFLLSLEGGAAVRVRRDQ